MDLSGSQYEQLTDALLQAFPSQARLRRMVRYRLGMNLSAISMGDDLTSIVFGLIEEAEAGGWTAELIVAACRSNPSNPLLRDIAQALELAPSIPPKLELQRIIEKANAFLDVATWRNRLGEIENKVCCIELKSGGTLLSGTGFLVAPDVVITNHHVMKPVIDTINNPAGKPHAKPSDVILRFDYKRTADGQVIDLGSEYGLRGDDWLIDWSPMSPVDDIPEPKDSVPEPDELDYALLRLDGAPGDKAVGKAEPGAPKRGYVGLPTQPADIRPGMPVSIVQHPRHEPLKLAISTEGICYINSNGTRVTYRTNTERGSSGSPCFTINWELIALHHAGDPEYSANHNPEYNQGIPIRAILALLEKRGLSHVLGTS